MRGCTAKKIEGKYETSNKKCLQGFLYNLLRMSVISKE